MKARVQSNIHLLTGKSPSAKVQCHSTSRSSHSPLTNAFLKEGGALPSVLPVDDFVIESSCKPQTVGLVSVNPSDILKKETRKHAAVPQHPNHLHACQLEKKMEHLSNKLTKVQDILETHLIDTAPVTSSHCIEEGENVGFSARDYAFLLLEMNASIPSRPYDPNEFSENIS